MNRRAFLAGCSVLFARRVASAESLVDLGKLATSYAIDPEHRSRASNVQLAAEAIDGKTIPAGATFSFNEAVGARTAAFGYEKAQVLRDGMLAEGTGGGACQVASTLHAAALLAGLEIAHRVPHSRPSAYIRMSLDATVAYPKIDLKIANPTADDVSIVAKAANGNLTVAIRGKTRLGVRIASEILERTAVPRVFERDHALGADEVRRTAFGIPGYKVKRTRTITLVDGTTRTDLRIDIYPPVPETLRVPSNFDIARLAPPEDEEHAAMAKVTILTGSDVVRPLPIQIRPSTLVTVDNSN